jgi:DNA recombination protein RmuC
MIITLLAILLLLNLILVGMVFRRGRRGSADPALAALAARLDAIDQGLSQKFASATADMASRLELTKGDLRQQISDRLGQGFTEIRSAVDQQLAAGRGEQTTRLAEVSTGLEGKFDALRTTTENKLESFARSQTESLRVNSGALEQKFEQLSARQAENLAQNRQELSGSLALATSRLTAQIESFNQVTAQSLEAMRTQVEEKLGAISNEVQQKLDTNIREGFQHFVKVQEHLKAAEEQLRQVGTLGASINDLNNLLKLPHLRGRFGEASLERLLTDFLPASMYEFQAPLPGGGRVDAIINFPDRRLPVDAKFPREQVLPLFETSDEASLTEAREQLVRVLKIEAKRIAAYIQPENGTMDVALMYLPSETLYLETIRNEDAMSALAELQVFPVSPNTLLMTLRTVSLAYKWYEVAARFEETRKELGRAQTALGHFQKQFDVIGKSLEKAQSAYDTASRHLKTYRSRVTNISGEAVPEADDEPLALGAKAE